MPPHDPLLDEISAFLSRPVSEDDAASLERALTDGYARVLSLETDRVRIEKQITRLAAAIAERDASGSRRLRTLSRERETRTRDLARLRAALGELRGRYSLAVRAGR